MIKKNIFSKSKKAQKEEKLIFCFKPKSKQPPIFSPKLKFKDKENRTFFTYDSNNFQVIKNHIGKSLNRLLIFILFLQI